ncbi:MAG TPA: class II glutamine amidotransferase [Ktedonobacteraceae bacterium]|jgi:predicted glutamine amidotransferase
MCRLLGYVTREPGTIASQLNSTLEAFVEASHLHADGWGFAWYNEQDQLQLAKAPEAAFTSQEFSSLAEDTCTDAFLGHLRWATPGFLLCMANTHPFAYGQVAFAHNGIIRPNAELEKLIAPHLRGQLTGTTDSERHFFALLSALESADPVEAIRAYMSQLHERTQIISANFLLLTPDTFYAVCDFDPQSEQSQKEPDYFPLKYRVTADAVVVGSTGLGQDEQWQTVENGQMLLVSRDTLEVALINLLVN